MAIQYPGGTIVNTTFTGTDRAAIGTALETHLVTAGWTVISGSGSTDRVLESATTPTAANLIRVRIRTTNLTNCTCLNMQNAAASRVSQSYVLLPGVGKTYRIIANQYQFFCFTPGGSVSREFVAMGVPWIPSFLHGLITGEFGWICGNGGSDTDTTLRASFRTLLHCASASSHYWSGLVNSSLVDVSSSPAPEAGGLRMVTQSTARYGATASVNGYRWHDDSLQLADPLIAWGLAAVTDETKIRGQLWGAMIATDAFTVDTVLPSVDGHSWHAITGGNVGGSNEARGTLFVATS